MIKKIGVIDEPSETETDTSYISSYNSKQSDSDISERNLLKNIIDTKGIKYNSKMTKTRPNTPILLIQGANNELLKI